MSQNEPNTPTESDSRGGKRRNPWLSVLWVAIGALMLVLVVYAMWPDISRARQMSPAAVERARQHQKMIEEEMAREERSAAVEPGGSTGRAGRDQQPAPREQNEIVVRKLPHVATRNLRERPAPRSPTAPLHVDINKPPSWEQRPGSGGTVAAKPEAPALDQKAREKLRDLGYIRPGQEKVRGLGYVGDTRRRGRGGYGGRGGGHGGYGGGGRAQREVVLARPAILPGEELWVIARVDAPAKPAEKGPRCGTLIATRPADRKEVSLPLKHTDVDASIAGYVATVNVTQQYQNPYDGKIEAKYVFPLPQNAAVNEFIMTVGERRIRGIIRERKQAERIYKQARRQGHVASLLTQERPNVFTQAVANIESGKSIDIDIKYFHTLAYADGWYEFVFPMVVGPRFNPPGSTDGIGAVGRGKQGRSGQKTEVQYLKPGERSGHDIALAVRIDAGVKIEQIACRSHVIEETRPSPSVAQVKLGRLDAIPNKDFVLRYKVAGETVKSALMTHQDHRGGFFTLMLYPPADQRSLARGPLELVFVLDCSGSMSGKPIAQAKRAVKRALQRMRPDDTFQVIRFSNRASQLGPAPLEATAENVRRGLEYVDTLNDGGGTIMIEGIKAALDFPHDPRRLRFVVFLTDGYIGNESRIFAAVQNKLGASRIFSFGVGSSPNRYLLDGLANLGTGTVAYLGLNDSAADVMDLFFDRASHPAITDIKIDWGDLKVADVFPARIPDLFVGRPIVLSGRFEHAKPSVVRVRGKVGDHTRDIALNATFDDSARHAGLAAIWARTKIADLSARTHRDRSGELTDQIKRLALDYGLMSAYTAFVAVDSLVRTAGGYGTTVSVPVPVPAGVRYDTTVSE